MRCTIKRVISEADELGYEIIFSDGSMVTYLDPSTLYSVPLNNECYVLDVVPDFSTQIEAPRGTIGSVNEKDYLAPSHISCFAVMEIVTISSKTTKNSWEVFKAIRGRRSHRHQRK